MAVALLSMVTALGVPMYRDTVARGHRALIIETLRERAWEVMLDGNSAMPGRARTGQWQTFSGDDAADMQTPAAMSPRGALRGIYRIRVAGSPDGTAYVRATPVPGGPMGRDACGTFELGSNGVQRNIGPGGERLSYAQQRACWGGRG